MEVRRLTETAFQATFTPRMREITGAAHDAIDIWPYVNAVPPGDLQGLRLHADEVQHVWRDAYDRYDHVMLPLTRNNAYLVVVVELRLGAVHGHHVLDLGTIYGTSEA